MTALADLERKRREAAQRKDAIADERGRSAFGALTAGKGAAQLAELRERALRIDLEIGDLDSAITSAKAQLAAARREDALEEKREQARAALPCAAKLRQNGRRVGDAIAQLGAALAAIKADMAEAGRLGVRAPSFDLFRSNLRRALDTSLSPVGLQHDLVAPGQRVEVATLIENYASAIEREVSAICGERPRSPETKVA